MLGFGVVVGSLVTGSAASELSPLVIAVSPSSQNANAISSAGGAGSDSSSGGGPQTITVTTPSGSSGGVGGVGGALVGGTGGGSSSPSLNPSGPPIKHVFMLMLSSQGFNETFGRTSADPYLAKTLVKQGELVQNYYAVAAGPLANEIAVVSGQGPTPNTDNNCPVYDTLVPGDSGSSGQTLGTGCVYPKGTESIADQLSAANLTWKAYIQTIGSGKAAALEACRHPRTGAKDRSDPPAGDPYVTWRNPFLYFQSLLSGKPCPKNDVALGQLAKDLKSTSSTPTLSYIVANPCDDGSDTPCGPGAESGPAAADTFLKSVIPQIMHSAAYKADGLIAITYDQAPSTGPHADASSCCGTPKYPNLIGFAPPPSGPTGPSGPSGPTGPPSALIGGQTNPTGGGGQVGLLLLSKFVSPGIPEVTDYFNHFSLLASIEQVIGLKKLGYAAAKSLPLFSANVWSAYGGSGF
jgi:hypothetical protein